MWVYREFQSSAPFTISQQNINQHKMCFVPLHLLTTQHLRDIGLQRISTSELSEQFCKSNFQDKATALEVRTNPPAAQPRTARQALIHAPEPTSRAVRPQQRISRLSLARTQLLYLCTHDPVNPGIRKATPGSGRAVGTRGQAGGGSRAARWGCSPLRSTAGCSWSRDSPQP